MGENMTNQGKAEKIFPANSFPTPPWWYWGLQKKSFTTKLTGKKVMQVFKNRMKYTFSEEYYPVPNSLRSIFYIKCVKKEGI